MYPSSWPFALQKLFDPLQQVIADGCHLNRDSKAAVLAAGFTNADGLEELDIDGMGILSPFVAGLIYV